MISNGTGGGIGHQPTGQDIDTVIAAFQACLDPRTANDVRRRALEYVELVTSRPEALQLGISLANDHDRPQAVRYFGLQLLEYAIRHRFDSFDGPTLNHTLAYVVDLATNCNDNDPSFYRNKVAQLWVECAERAWPDQWQDMDTMLDKLWTQSVPGQCMASAALVLDILEALSSGICGDENPTVARIDDLGSALNEVITSRQFHERQVKDKHKFEQSQLRSNDEGWLVRITRFVLQCTHQLRLDTARNDQSSVRDCVVRAVTTAKSIASWIEPSAIVDAELLGASAQVLALNDADLQCSVLDLLRTVALKAQNSVEAGHVLRFLLDLDRLSMFESFFTAAASTSSDEESYHQLQKKASELLSVVIDTTLMHPDIAVNSDGYDRFLMLLLQVLQSNSLVVSIPVLHGWTKLLASRHSTLPGQANEALGVLMQVSAQRLVNFESLGEDFDHPLVTSLFEDFDTTPERHAFLANYRRYCVSVIEQIARRMPVEAVEHVVRQTRELMSTGPYTVAQGLMPQTYSKRTLPVQQIEAQFVVNHSVINALSRRKPSDRTEKASASLTDEEHGRISATLKQFCRDLCLISLDDPEAEGGLVALLSSIVRNNVGMVDLVVEVCRYILDTSISIEGSSDSFRECVKNFESIRVVELQKIALAHADVLLSVYDEFENTIATRGGGHDIQERVLCGYHAFLFIIVLRAKGLSRDVRMNRLQRLLQPLYSMWTTSSITHSTTSFQAFQDSLGFADLAQFYQEQDFAGIEDWTTQQLNGDGRDRLGMIRDRASSLPLRMTRALMGATTEKLESGSDTYDMACQVWEPLMPTILPPLLSLVRYAQAFSNLNNWSTPSDDLQAVIRRTLQDRFWQSGISNESRDEFYARVSGSKTSYEGFASAVRGTVRNVREQGYQILFLFTKFDEQFYGIPDLPRPLAGALFDDADSLSANHLNPLISLVTGIVQRCPPQYRASFLPPLLHQMFDKLDRKLTSDWESTIRITDEVGEQEDLSEEMRIESVLRQVTYAAVSFVAFLLDTDRTHDRPSLNEVTLSNSSVLEPLLLFCTHALRMRDTRCCTTMCRILISMLPRFMAKDEASSQVREFFSTEVLKAGITSLNEQYFADMQRDLAALIAQILVLYSRTTATPRAVLLSLPNMQESRVDHTLSALLKSSSARQQRALVLGLLESIRGVSIHDMGRLVRSKVKAAQKSVVQSQYMEVEHKPAIVRGDEVGLDSMANLFGNE